MYDTILPMTLGSVSTDTDLANHLGNRYVIDGVEYVLVKSTGTITASKLILQWADASAYTVDAVAGAAHTKGEVAGLGISGQSAISSGDYFFVIRRGPGTATSQTTSLAAHANIATHSTAGKVDDGTVTYATAIGWTTEAQASADSDVGVFMDLP